MPDNEWYPVYNTATKDVIGVGAFSNPESLVPGDGLAVGEAQTSAMPFGLDLENPQGTYHYTYNTETNLVEAKV